MTGCAENKQEMRKNGVGRGKWPKGDNGAGKNTPGGRLRSAKTLGSEEHGVGRTSMEGDKEGRPGHTSK